MFKFTKHNWFFYVLYYQILCNFELAAERITLFLVKKRICHPKILRYI